MFVFFGHSDKFMFWQSMQKAYASEITDHLSSLGLYADVDNSDNTLPKKIRNGEISQYNFILGNIWVFTSFFWKSPIIFSAVVGQEELDARSVNVRNRDDVGTKARGTILPLDTVVNQLVTLKKSRSLENKLVWSCILIREYKSNY